MIFEENELNNIAAYNLDEYIKELGNSAMLIDVRDKDKYFKEHIRGAVNIPYKEILDKKIQLPTDKVFIIYCDRGGLSMTISRYLHKRGYKVVNVIGGLRNYKSKLNKK